MNINLIVSILNNIKYLYNVKQISYICVKLNTMVKCTLHSGEPILINKSNIQYCIEGTLPQYGNELLTKVVFDSEKSLWVKHNLTEFDSILLYSD